MSGDQITERTVRIDEHSLHMAEAGDPGAPTIVLIHGIYDRWEGWEPVIPAFARDYHVIAPDLRGHARSSKEHEAYEFEDYVADMVAFLDTTGREQAIIVGHSLGALVGLYLAGHRTDRVRALVLEEPPLELDEQSRDMMRMLLEAKRGTEEETYKFFEELYWHLDEQEWWRQTAWLRDTADGPFEAIIDFIDHGRGPELIKLFWRVHCPTLLLQADPMAGAALSDTAAEHALANLSHGQLVTFPDTGHVIHRERPDEFVETVTDFLREHS